MSLNDTPTSNRVHIGFFGKRNAGKSSLVNAVTDQDLAVVSDVMGTTTDPVYKAMELLPLGPVVVIDTPGLDDVGYLGEKRVRKARQVLNKTDVAVLVADAREGLGPEERGLLELFAEKGIPRVVAYNKCDLLPSVPEAGPGEIYVSATERSGIRELKETLARLNVSPEAKLRLVGDLVSPSDLVVLVIPIDKAAPKGRLILPQQQTIRDILEADACAVVVKEFELRELFGSLAKKPRLVVTDSQVFAKVSADVPRDVPLTSFSILFARQKGMLDAAARGALAIDRLKDGDAVLVSEGCTHHRQCDDIGTVKLPRWIRNYTGRKLDFKWSTGGDFPEDLGAYALVVHCGGCMLNEREMRHRLRRAQSEGVPITNFGTAIAQMQGILKRSLEVFPHLSLEFDELEAEARAAGGAAGRESVDSEGSAAGDASGRAAAAAGNSASAAGGAAEA
ncbi:MAG: [FeFe] hydrogenase H-cluster maturation GTPase HydF [Deltaproteobacteria bacterium]|jgi:[FeFe] hydrogenase H-cluster maturation GTPase HydF|nr:[FeFe] hydrogenase H-cluster maturation GTPase HydF [Deltaproteobacteria bacterium]